MAFRLSKPDRFQFKAGQAITLAINDESLGRRQLSRMFSLVSAPFERDLIIATRIRDSAFKQTLKWLPNGTVMQITGPFGELTLGEPKVPAVFIAGGIGITPFMSMLRQAHEDKSEQRIFLVYSNRRPEDAPLIEELQERARTNRNFKFVATMTNMTGSTREWTGEARHIDGEILKRLVGDVRAPMYYVVGPPGMVAAMEATLCGAGIARGRIQSEQFYGY
jgi:ferredoxin-NADP reductase